MITRAFLRDWFVAHKCTIEPLKEFTKGTAVKVTGPNGGHWFMDCPIDEKPVRHFTACEACIRLGIEIISECQYMQEISEHIEKNHTKKKKRD